MDCTRSPNIIFIITDQQRYDTIGALGYPFARTPVLDRLVREGTSFDQCHVAGASCVPARASLFNGYYPHTTGILRNADLWRHSWVEKLSAAGYTCVNIGKMHTWPLDTPCGFAQRHVVENKDRFLEARFFFDEWDKALAARGTVKQQRQLYREYPDYDQRLGAFTWDLAADLHSDQFVADRACWWIENHPKVDRLFLQVGFPGPHPPYDPTPAALAEYAGCRFPIAPVRSEDLAGQPDAFAALRRHNEEVDHDSLVHVQDPPAEARQRQRAHYMANLSMIDAALGRLLSVLGARGYLEDAIVVFTSDHGDCLGDHGHSQKWTMYEQVTRVPLVVHAPGRVSAGMRSNALVQQMDIAPWLLEQAGARYSPSLEARSLGLAWAQPGWTGREAVYCEQGRDDVLTEVELMTMVRTARWKLVHLLHQEQGQLFDLESDPAEETNLWDRGSHAAVREQLVQRLLAWRMDSQLRTRNWVEQYR